MNIEDLHIFCQVVEEGNFSKVARMNYLSQPAVTQKMNKLEELYQVALFKRAHGKITLTPAAHIVYPFAKEMVNHYRHSKQAVSEHVQAKEQTITIGASYTIGEYILPQMIGAFNELQQPPIKFQLLIRNTPAILDALERDEIEIACIEGTADKENFLKREMARDALVPVVAANHPLARESLIDQGTFLKEKMIWREKDSGMRHVIEDALPIDPDRALELGSIQAIKSAVEANLGVTILPKIAIQKELALGSLQEIMIEGISLERKLWFVQKKQPFSRGLIHAFRQFLIESLAK